MRLSAWTGCPAFPVSCLLLPVVERSSSPYDPYTIMNLPPFPAYDPPSSLATPLRRCSPSPPLYPRSALRAVISASAAAAGATAAVATITPAPTPGAPTADVAAAVAAARRPFRTAAALVAAATRSPPCRYPWARRVTDGGADADAF